MVPAFPRIFADVGDKTLELIAIHTRLLDLVLPVAVLLDEADQPLDRLLLRDIPQDAGLALVEADLPSAGAHITVVGVRHLARAIDDAAHDADLEPSQVGGGPLDLGDRRLQVVERTATARA